ncbi:catechol O-methyltransferase domain-containing protein 1-like [Xenia sp. Carnegie-2017]|uniref:catechol O-methyltransferase domain-containing protein 1-like n=1 Tax=Xenia sp. Carnegie-2017 TaxID=2897299 RepID=UPI001F04F7F3|nr:catechol O-methyltransferase domain-containing protein 1-like [Xenia sp. Carnegie-2017]
MADGQEINLMDYLCSTRKVYKNSGFNPIVEYVWKNSQREPDILRRLYEKTLSMSSEIEMIADPLECQLLHLMLHLMNAKKAIEIGVYTGYNLLNVALALPKDGKIIACDVSSDDMEIGRPFLEEAGVMDKVDLRIQPAIKTLDELLEAGEAGTFDFIFIDADKVNYMNYYERGLKLLKSGGLIAVDNALWSGRVTKDEKDEKTKVIHKLNQFIHKDERVLCSLLPLGDGVYFAVKI